MVPISSAIEGSVREFAEAKERLHNYRFSLGGGWEYNEGTFDRELDDNHKVWLRIPFAVVRGNIDPEGDSNATIRFGQPFVLKHLYNEGNDPEGSVRLFGAMFDQFQAPVNPDAKVEQAWLDKARSVLSEVEAAFSR
ncbi:YugN family protein [Paenibacillus thailandensis]|uniref:YugN family protein n=1 Tax=Paenibacillus thailandensis TaxID=393250 RepID=A0ABW5QRU2_9BACL